MTPAPARTPAVVLVPPWGFAALGLLAAVANANFLLRRAVGSTLDPASTEISLLSVAGQPASWAFRAADTAAGLSALLLALAALLVTSTFRGSRRAHGRLLAAGLAAFGFGTVASAAVTLSCAMRSTCTDSAAQDGLHDGLSVLATLGTVLGCVLLLRLRAGRASLAALTGEAALATAVTAFAALQVIYWLGGLDAGSGWVQRGQVLATSIWLGLVGVLLARFTGGTAWRAPGSDRRSRAAPLRAAEPVGVVAEAVGVVAEAVPAMPSVPVTAPRRPAAESAAVIAEPVPPVLAVPAVPAVALVASSLPTDLAQVLAPALATPAATGPSRTPPRAGGAADPTPVASRAPRIPPYP